MWRFFPLYFDKNKTSTILEDMISKTHDLPRPVLKDEFWPYEVIDDIDDASSHFFVSETLLPKLVLSLVLLLFFVWSKDSQKQCLSLYTLYSMA